MQSTERGKVYVHVFETKPKRKLRKYPARGIAGEKFAVKSTLNKEENFDATNKTFPIKNFASQTCEI